MTWTTIALLVLLTGLDSISLSSVFLKPEKLLLASAVHVPTSAVEEFLPSLPAVAVPAGSASLSVQSSDLPETSNASVTVGASSTQRRNNNLFEKESEAVDPESTKRKAQNPQSIDGILTLALVVLLSILILVFVIWAIARFVRFVWRRSRSPFYPEIVLRDIECSAVVVRGLIRGDPSRSLGALVSYVATHFGIGSATLLYMALIPKRPAAVDRQPVVVEQIIEDGVDFFSSVLGFGRPLFDKWFDSYIGWWRTEHDWRMFMKFNNPPPIGTIRLINLDRMYARVSGTTGNGELVVHDKVNRRVYVFTANDDGGPAVHNWRDALHVIHAKLQMVKKYSPKTVKGIPLLPQLSLPEAMPSPLETDDKQETQTESKS
eukprot:TRINITY_DN57753_c0_g1_i1.p1 TRINITY_DN57753_c0_g1~~TRINITY_DN57753_c0_g1_i1.p1  ORF type:complete len:376 (+),score=37.47 TRINITY_DN57753_c0_g1_i1:165-1292(+)